MKYLRKDMFLDPHGDWAVSCEDGYDWLDFIADGEIRESITGETGWKAVAI